MKHPFLKIEFQKSHNKSYSTDLGNLFVEYKDSGRLQENELEIFGLYDMVSGLEYHQENFVEMEEFERERLKIVFQEQRILSEPSENNTLHEVVAYFNRLGQIQTLFDSAWFRKYVEESNLVALCPMILALMPFRHKFASHRSIDDPKKETESQKANHAGLPFVTKWISSIVEGELGINNIKKLSETELHRWDMDLFEKSSIAYQIKISNLDSSYNRSCLLRKFHKAPVEGIELFAGEEIWITFIPVQQHDKICTEIIEAARAFLSRNNPEK